MQTHERIGAKPVSSDAVAAVDEDDAYVGVVDQGIGERHAHGTGPDDQVVSLDSARHRATQARAPARRPSPLWIPFFEHVFDHVRR